MSGATVVARPRRKGRATGPNAMQPQQHLRVPNSSLTSGRPRSNSNASKRDAAAAHVNEVDIFDKLYCLCRQPWTDDDHDMIQCDSCQDWFHPECVGLPNVDAVPAEQEWFCPSCRSPAGGDQELSSSSSMADDSPSSAVESNSSGITGFPGTASAAGAAAVNLPVSGTPSSSLPKRIKSLAENEQHSPGSTVSGMLRHSPWSLAEQGMRQLALSPIPMAQAEATVARSQGANHVGSPGRASLGRASSALDTPSAGELGDASLIATSPSAPMGSGSLPITGARRRKPHSARHATNLKRTSPSSGSQGRITGQAKGFELSTASVAALDESGGRRPPPLEISLSSSAPNRSGIATVMEAAAETRSRAAVASVGIDDRSPASARSPLHSAMELEGDDATSASSLDDSGLRPDSGNKRQFHNERERQRRSTIRNLFDHLRRNVPAVESQEGSSDRQILVEAAKHVEQLRHDSHSLEEALIQLRIENLKLRMGTSESDCAALQVQLLQLLGEAAEIARIKEEYSQPPPLSPVRKGRGSSRPGGEHSFPSVGSAPASLSRAPALLGQNGIAPAQGQPLRTSLSPRPTVEAKPATLGPAAHEDEVVHVRASHEPDHRAEPAPAAPSGGEDLLELLMVVERERQELGQGAVAGPGPQHN